MTRFFIAIVAFVFSLYVSVTEVEATHVAKTDTLTQTALSVESSCKAPVQTEKLFLPCAEYQLAEVHAAYFTSALHAPVYTHALASLNIRGPPTTLS